MRIFHTVNCGLRIEESGYAVLIDMIHAGAASCMNEMPPQLLCDMKSGTGVFERAGAVVFTHMHEDHFDEKLLREYRNTAHGREVPVYAPGFSENTLCPEPAGKGTDKAIVGQMEVFFVNTLHEHEIYRDVIHRSIIVKSDDRTVLVAGDAMMHECETDGILYAAGGRIDIAIMNPFQIAGENGQKFCKTVKPKQILVYHIPDRELDQNSYRMITRSAIRSWSVSGPTPVIFTKMSCVEI